MAKLKLIGIIVLLLLLGIAAYYYYGNYSEGERAGIMFKLSKKGTILKTFEGELNVGNYLTDNTNLSSSVWKFSVDDDQEEVIKKLEDAILNGRRVKILYKEKFIYVPWRGDTKYFVYKVEQDQPR